MDHTTLSSVREEFDRRGANARCVYCGVVTDDHSRACDSCTLEKRQALRRCNKCDGYVDNPDPTTYKGCSCFTSSNMRECGACRKKKIPRSAESWKDRCTDCFRDKKVVTNEYKVGNFAACSDCGDLAIPKSQASWRKLCGPCYAVSKTKCKECEGELTDGEDGICGDCVELVKDMKRACAECGEDKIDYNAGHYVVICGDCQATKPMRLCATCKQPKIPDSDPSWKKVCGQCFAKSKR